MNRLYPHPIIAREGWPIIGGGLALSLLLRQKINKKMNENENNPLLSRGFLNK